jgi:hypothetical protein
VEPYAQFDQGRIEDRNERVLLGFAVSARALHAQAALEERGQQSALT